MGGGNDQGGHGTVSLRQVVYAQSARPRIQDPDQAVRSVQAQAMGKATLQEAHPMTRERVARFREWYRVGCYEDLSLRGSLICWTIHPIRTLYACGEVRGWW